MANQTTVHALGLADAIQAFNDWPSKETGFDLLVLAHTQWAEGTMADGQYHIAVGLVRDWHNAQQALSDPTVLANQARLVRELATRLVTPEFMAGPGVSAADLALLARVADLAEGYADLVARGDVAFARLDAERVAKAAKARRRVSRKRS